MFFRPPKIGKTSLASGFPQSLFLATSAKEVKAIKTDFVVINTWMKGVEAVNELTNQTRRKYKHLIIDVVDVAWTNCITEVCHRLDIKHPSEAGYGKGVDMIDLEFKKWITALVASDYGLIFVSHMQTKDVFTGGKTVTKTISTLPDRARKIVLPLISNIGYINVESIKIKDKVTGKMKFVDRRCISFEPTETLEAGSRDNVLPSVLPLPRDSKKSYQLFKDYYTGAKVK